MNWADKRLEELHQKGRESWNEGDWEDYYYCKNANAERDYYDSVA